MTGAGTSPARTDHADAPGSPVIDVHGLNKHFGDKHVVVDLALRVERGEIFGFLGPNGSGKTTSIRLMCGLLTPDSGSGTCLGFDILKDSDKIKRHVGYMTQRFSFWDDLTIRENLDFVASIYAMPQRREVVLRALDDLGLAGRADQLTGTLSGGWKQRLALAACMLHEPQLLLLDEPTAGVDPNARRDFWEELHRLAATGVSVLVSTHYMDEAERCHKLAYIAYGRLLAQGTAAEVIASQHLTTFEVRGPDLTTVAEKLRGQPGVEKTAAFGDMLHVTGTDAAALERALKDATAGSGVTYRHVDTGLEDVFIHLISQAADNWGRADVSNAFSWHRWWAMVRKEFLQLRRDRITFAMIVGVPVIQLTLFGYAINTDPKHMPTAVIAADQSEFTRSLISAMTTSEYFRMVGELPDEAAGRSALARGTVQFVLTIPPEFTRRLLRGERPAVLLEADASDPTATGAALAAISQLANVVARKDLTGPLAQLAGKPPPFDVQVHRLYNPESLTQYNIVPGLMGVILTMTMVMMTGLAITRERERGTMENLLAMPLKPVEVMTGKIMPYIAIGLIQGTIILLAARWVFAVPFVGSLGALFVAALLFIACNLTVGITLSSLAQNQLQAMQLTFFYFLPNILLSGFMFPFQGMPNWAQGLGSLLPLTYFNRLVRGILLKGSDWGDMWPSMWPMLIFLLVVMTIAVRFYRRTLD